MIKNLFKFVILFTAFSWAVSCSEQEFYEWNEPVEDEEINGSTPDKPKPEPNPNPNPNPNPSPEPEPQPQPDPEKPSGYAGRIEVPTLKGGNMNIFHTWTTRENGKETVTYSYEYDCSKKHVRWVAFTFDNVTCQSKVERSDAWKTDPNIPKQYQTSRDDYRRDKDYKPKPNEIYTKDYTRGHMVGSGDRVYSKAANEQTFYYSNMSPQQETGFNTGGGVWNNLEDQIQDWAQIKNSSDTLYVVKGGTYYSNMSPQQETGFNTGGGVWNNLEDQIQDWAQIKNSSDTLYVVKGGTIDKNEHIREWTKTGVAVPKYYYMAIVSYKNKQYKGVAFWVEHKNNKTKNVKQYAMSIRDLEKMVNINFFSNLAPEIEEQVETHYTESDWSWRN